MWNVIQADKPSIQQDGAADVGNVTAGSCLQTGPWGMG